MQSALEGLRVLDLTQLLPGPFATMLLADHGADVIKIERPGEGDPGRHRSPVKNGVSLLHVMLNRNKRSLALDLKHPQGRAVFLDLVRTADVVVEGFRPGVLTRLGIDYPVAEKINPRIIYCSISGYGAVGPHRDEPGHDINYLAMSGTLAMNGGRSPHPSLPPTQIADLVGGSLQALLAIFLALSARERTGRGQAADVSMTDGAFFLQVEALAYAMAGEQPTRGRTRLTGRYPCYNLYPTKDDRHMAVGANERKFWENLCSILELPGLVDAQYAEGDEGERAIAALNQAFRGRTQAEWQELLRHRETCCTAVLDVADVLESPQVAARGLLINVEHPVVGQVRQFGFPIKLSDTPGRYCSPAPAVGQHSEEVLRAAGYSTEQIAALVETSVITTERHP